MPSSVATPPSTGVFRTSVAPAFSASPRSESMKAWLSTMPVEGDDNAPAVESAGSSDRASEAERKLQVRDAVGRGARGDGRQALRLVGRRGDDELAAPSERNAAFAAIGVERLAAGDAEARHQAAGGIVDAGVDDFAVARGGLRADRLGRLEHDDLAPGERQRTRDGEADHARAGDHTVQTLQCLTRRRAAASLRHPGNEGLPREVGF